MKASYKEVATAIEEERCYQDGKWGTPDEHPHDVGAWVTIMRCELREAEDAWMKGTDDDALAEIVQVVAVGFAALQQHGVHTRYDK